MSLTSRTVTPSFSEGIIKTLAWGFKPLTISSWCVSFSDVHGTGYCQGRALRSDPICLHLFIFSPPRYTTLPLCSSRHSCFCYLGNKGKLIKKILACQQLSNRHYLSSIQERAMRSLTGPQHASTDFLTIQICLPLRSITRESFSVKVLLCHYSWKVRETQLACRQTCSSAWDSRHLAEQELGAYITVTSVMACFH